MKRTNKGILVLLTAFLLCACNEKPKITPIANNPVDTHEHEWTPWEVIEEPTCINTGARERYCMICSKVETKIIEVDSIYGHSYMTVPQGSLAPTCTAEGFDTYECRRCGNAKRIPVGPLGHSYTIVESTTATCTYDGENTMKCSRCGGISETKEPQSALGHNYVDDPTYTEGLRPTCTGSGTAREKCTRCNETRIIELDPLGHDFKDDNVEDTYASTGKATLVKGTCDNCARHRYVWKANQVTENCKTSKRAVFNEDGSIRYYEANYVEVGDGVSFFGRAIHNAQWLDMQFNSPEQLEPKYDENVVGSFLEYQIELEDNLEHFDLIAKPDPSYISEHKKLFECDEADWTPGLKDSNLNKYDFKYIVTIDGTEFEMDKDYLDKKCYVEDWVVFPIRDFNLTAGMHTIKLTMSGGGLIVFYNFGLQRANVSGPCC